MKRNTKEVKGNSTLVYPKHFFLVAIWFSGFFFLKKFFFQLFGENKATFQLSVIVILPKHAKVASKMRKTGR
jgi:hypothetical protein